ncbi:hypothetical protein D3H55_22800 [Bacillus salacetis]|uniref:RNase H type-1 domain-containing protein n=1 Tax=Bacillus salacetis TaxID=2315464 RepID=A0A3A1QNN2_9BACI|nr:hypothetical protein [Bacillus salacetis]RIW27621.1 hypothetical protein D3H55_22800 [Bacillus salacetis]
MKSKGNPKGTNKPDFWKNVRNSATVAEELKERVYNEYYSRDSLYVYCDSSMNVDKRLMAVACTYVSNANIIVKRQLVYPSHHVADKSIYGELKSIIFALTHFQKYMDYNCKKVQVYSDVNHIDKILNDEIKFRKHPLLKELKDELNNLYQSKNVEHRGIEINISYLNKERRIYNPFAKCSHNKAKNLLLSSK